MIASRNQAAKSPFSRWCVHAVRHLEEDLQVLRPELELPVGAELPLAVLAVAPPPLVARDDAGRRERLPQDGMRLVHDDPMGPPDAGAQIEDRVQQPLKEGGPVLESDAENVDDRIPRGMLQKLQDLLDRRRGLRTAEAHGALHLRVVPSGSRMQNGYSRSRSGSRNAWSFLPSPAPTALWGERPTPVGWMGRRLRHLIRRTTCSHRACIALILVKSTKWKAKRVELLGNQGIEKGLYPSDHCGLVGVFAEEWHRRFA